MKSIPMPASTPPASTVLDADLDRTGDVVVAMRAESGVDVHFLRSGATQRLATPMLRPAVRWINPARALLYDEWGAESERNALIVDENGITDSPFAIGGAVADVVSVGKYVAATYTDEGALGDDERSQAGIALFDRRGECLWMWNSSAARDLAPVFDCYAVGQGSDTTLGFLFYTLHDAGSYAFGLLDMETRGVTLFETPEVLHRTRALTSFGDGAWLFAVRSDEDQEDQQVVAWRPGSTEYDLVAAPLTLRRGLSGCRFISVTQTSVHVVTASPNC